MTLAQIEAELRLFKAYTFEQDLDTRSTTIEASTSSIDKGILYTATIPGIYKNIAENMYGLKPEQWNATFHKSFSTVIDTPIEKLIAQQIIHYFTTYGLESLGIYDQDLVYIPHENLEIPEITEDIPLKVIRYINEEELSNKLMILLTSGIALSKQTVEDIMVLSDYIDNERFDEIKNKEVKIALYSKYGITPKGNMDFLRYVVYKTTNSTLYIQNNSMIHIIKNADKEQAYNLFKNYVERKDGYVKLAEIFLRNKNIFLAFKTKQPTRVQEKILNNIINRIRKLAVKNHKPLQANILDILNQIKTMKNMNDNKSDIVQALDKITIYREIRIINGLRYRLFVSNINNVDSIVYRIRNGKAFATTLNKYKSSREINVLQEIINLVENHLVQRLKPLIKDKTFYIPNNITYVAPTSEKQFVGEIPEGSYIEIPRTSNMVIGVHWFNLDNARVDLDLKLLNKTRSYGWDVAYLSESTDIVFSGDVTDAPRPNGATETFLIAPKIENKSFLIKLNNFTQNKDVVPFEFFVAEKDTNEIGKDYIIDPNKVKMLVHNKFDVTNKNESVSTITLGYVEINSESIKIYFKNFTDVKGRISNIDEVNKHIFEYTDLYSKVQLTLNDLITRCGGVILDTPNTDSFEEAGVSEDGTILYKKVQNKLDYDLSIETLTKDSIIQIFNER